MKGDYLEKVRQISNQACNKLKMDLNMEAKAKKARESVSVKFDKFDAGDMPNELLNSEEMLYALKKQTEQI